MNLCRIFIEGCGPTRLVGALGLEADKLQNFWCLRWKDWGKVDTAREISRRSSTPYGGELPRGGEWSQQVRRWPHLFGGEWSQRIIIYFLFSYLLDLVIFWVCNLPALFMWEYYSDRENLYNVNCIVAASPLVIRKILLKFFMWLLFLLWNNKTYILIMVVF